MILHCGTFGRGLSGKTFLNKKISRSYWQKLGVRSIVLDPMRSDWGDHAFVTDDEEKFSDMVWKRETGCAIFCDEASDTINRERAKSSLFTRIRHRGHRLHVMGHSGTNLLPQQREQIHCLFLFLQTAEAAKIWADCFVDRRVMESMSLRPREFLRCVLGAGPDGTNLIQKCALIV